MVNPISSNNVTRLRPTGETDTAAARHGAAPTAQRGGGIDSAADNVNLSAQASRLPEALTKGPPIDRALVDRIGEAVAEGRYPIKPDLIADALLRDFHDMNF